MSTDLKNSASNIHEQSIRCEQQKKKIDEVRAAIGSLPEKLSRYCSDATIARYLRARNWNVKKAIKMLKETLKWRSEFKPEEICWDDIAFEAESGKIYRSNAVDKKGRTVLVMRPCCQNSNSLTGQIKYLVYCMENAILNLPPDQEQMLWLVDFWNFSLSNISIKLTKETAHVLQNHYPERLGVAIMYNPPRIFEQFWTVAKPLLEPKTRKKVKFVYADDPNTMKILEELFDMNQLESAFGGNHTENFNIHNYAQRMKEDDEKTRSFWEKGCHLSAASNCNGLTDMSSPSDDDDDDPTEDGEHNVNGSTSLSTAEGSHDVSLSVTGMNLEDPGNVKA